MKKIFAFVFLTFMIFTANAQLNAKTIDYVKLDIVQSGTLRVTGFAQTANLSYYIPQEGVQDVKVTADGDITWKYIFDEFGNKLILVEWTKLTGIVNYRIELVVENSAKHSSDKPVGTNDFYLKETNYIKINDDIRQFAFPFEKSMKRAAELTQFVYDYVTYDLSYVGKNAPSDQVLVERRGVCVEHANLLAALLRANDIPTRYVVGYAYSSVQNKFIGHTWVEVLAVDGTWVPFDPTWLEAGYLDATHVKSAALLDNSQIDTLTYMGGSIDWTRNEEQINLMDHTEKSVTSISVTGINKTASGSYGMIKAIVSANECTITDLTANSCVNERGTKQVDIQESNRSLWICESKDVYWFFRTSGNNYICPVSVYDQTGGSAEFRVTVQGTSSQQNLFISGPDTVGTNELFTLTPSSNGIFYSPEFGVHKPTDAGGVSGAWTLSVKSPGLYRFYLYADGSLYVKTVTVVQKKEFGLGVEAPTTTKLGATFDINVTIKNLLDAKTVMLAIKYTNETIRRSLEIGKNGEKTLPFSLIANKEGLNDLVASVTGNSLATQTVIINTPTERTLLDNIFSAIGDFFSALFRAIGSLLGK